jgi:arylsulfatase A-like enzyme
MELPEPYVGDWARVFEGPRRGFYPTDTWRICVDPRLMHQMRAAYFGCINHINDQFARLFQVMPPNTILVFCSDHGEMLGDHQWLRKRNAYEPSARIPLLMKFPDTMRVKQGRVLEEPVELMDIMPTLLEAAGVAVPPSVDGRSLLPLLRGQATSWRDHVHGECAEVPTLDSGMQYVTDGKRKYVWFPGRGQEQFFDLEKDPREMRDLAGESSRSGEVSTWRKRLIEDLVDRPEGFTDGKTLLKLEGPTPFCLPGFERPG